MINEIDFSNFKPYQGKESKSFEVLWYHICLRKFGHLGEFTAIDGSGGDGGIEFYLELENGDIWGWQCKYFGGDGRLRDGRRKTQISGSLKTAISKKQNLKKWILCSKNDLTPDEIKWFNTKIKTYSQSVKTSCWGESYLSSFLSRPQFSGISHFFFGQLELTDEWFGRRFYENFENVKEKYDEDVHVKDMQAYTKVQKSLLSEEFFKEKENAISELFKELLNLKIVVADFKQKSHLASSDLKKIDEIIEQTNKNVDEFIIKSKEVIGKWSQKIKSKQYNDANNFDFDGLLFSDFYEFESKVKVYKDDISYSLQDISDKINEQIEKLYEILEFFKNNYWNPIVQDLHVFGDAGDGKTHLSCDIAKNYIDKKLPVIFIPAIKFSQQNSIEKAILTILDIPSDYTFDDFLSTLDTIGDIKNCRIPIIIDGLNETRGQSYNFSDLWEIHLKSFITKISSTKNIVLITTCRNSYKQKIWAGLKLSSNFIRLNGFVAPLDAMKKYFKKYKIKTTIRPFSISHFQKPIFLQIFCLAYKSNYNDIVELELSENVIFDTYEKYFKKINDTVIRRYDLPPIPKVIPESLKKIGLNLWIENKRAIALEDYCNLLNEGYNGEWTKSPAQILLNEDLLFVTEYQNEIEVVEFSYQFLAGYIIANSLIEQYKSTISEYFQENNGIEKLFSEDYEKIHPLFDDIRDSLATLLPMRLDVNLSDIFDNDISASLTVSAVFNLSNEKVNDAKLNLILRAFENVENRHEIFKLAFLTFFSPESKLNMSFWTNLLEKLSITERDLCWTEFIRKENNTILQIIDAFEKSLESLGKGEVKHSEKSHNLIAEFLMWVLTSTNLHLRDTATKALHNYSLIYPDNFLILTLKSIQINDAYIQERMLGVLYGLCLAKRFNRESNSFYSTIIPSKAKEIYKFIFDEDAPYSTTHIIIRDYASRILQLTQMYSKVFTDNETKNFKKPFLKGGIREWRESEPRETSKWYGPIHMDFDNYQIGYIVPNGHSYSNPPEKQQVRRQIYWRIYDLGYKEEHFEEIDKLIDSWQYRRGERPKVERYGKKYSWIAYYEIAGLREDLGLLRDKDFDDENHVEPRRFTDTLDICFPNEVRKFRLVENDQIGKDVKNLSQWIRDGGVSPIIYDKHLVINNLLETNEEWVCLDGFIDETDNLLFRSRFTFIRGAFIEKSEYQTILEYLRKQPMGGRWFPDPKGNYNLYLNEIGIWEEGYTYDSWVDLPFKIGKKTEKIGRDDPRFNWFIGKPFIFNDDDEFQNDNTETELEFIEREVDIKDKRKALLPVIKYAFESSDSTIKSDGCHLPNVEIQRYFNLTLKPKSFDYYDIDNKIASIYFEFNESNENRYQRFTFLRKDLFDEFLKIKNLEFVWVLWGERDIGNQGGHEAYKKFEEENGFSPRNVFSEIVSYNKL